MQHIRSWPVQRLPDPVRHPPQLSASLAVFTSQPSKVEPLQSSKPELQLATTQLPLVHAVVALGMLHALPQRPQLVRVSMGVSQPSSGSPLQSASPASQSLPQTPPEQDAAEPTPAEHTLSHAPQLSSSSSRAFSHPFATFPSQSPYPSWHSTISHAPK